MIPCVQYRHGLVCGARYRSIRLLCAAQRDSISKSASCATPLMRVSEQITLCSKHLNPVPATLQGRYKGRRMLAARTGSWPRSVHISPIREELAQAADSSGGFAAHCPCAAYTHCTDKHGECAVDSKDKPARGPYRIKGMRYSG